MTRKPHKTDVAIPERSTKDTVFRWEGNVLIINILGKPSSRSDAIGKPKGHQLKVSVTAAPDGGRATDHMVRFLAREFEVASSDIEVVFGQTSVNKQLRIHSPKRLPAIEGFPSFWDTA